MVTPPRLPKTSWLPDWAAHDRAWSRLLHHRGAKPWLIATMVGVSRMSDGWIWYVAILGLPWFGGATGLPCALRMTGLGLLNLWMYKTLKRYFARPRPFVACNDVRARTRSLDEYSFPSGHTLHAVAFTNLLTAYYPLTHWPLWAFAGLVALSRVVLGLHYLSDVLIGALLGFATAWAVLLLM